jgi:hypothetical protein
MPVDFGSPTGKPSKADLSEPAATQVPQQGTLIRLPGVYFAVVPSLKLGISRRPCIRNHVADI